MSLACLFFWLLLLLYSLYYFNLAIKLSALYLHLLYGQKISILRDEILRLSKIFYLSEIGFDGGN